MHRVGTAGWKTPAKPGGPGTHLTHYATLLSCTEVNSSFYRPHRQSTWARWAAETPPDFRFSVKAPQAITHDAKLANCRDLLPPFFAQISPLGGKLGPVLFQLPPSLQFDPSVAAAFLEDLRGVYPGAVALEPRHASWFTPEADGLLRQLRITRVAADPPKGSDAAAEPAGDPAFSYYRLHGSPRIYYSEYGKDWLLKFARRLGDSPPAWVIFDNTALGHAFADALHLQGLTHGQRASGACLP